MPQTKPQYSQFPAEMVGTPLIMLMFHDDKINSGQVCLDKWQIELLTHLGKHPSDFPDGRANQVMLLAANGSGKSKFILAPFAIWMTMRYQESQTIITSSSGKQLDEQDLLYCTMLANQINAVHKHTFPEGIFECQYRKIKNKVTGSIINMFATDEEGKAEGWHPITPGGEFAIIVDEGKTVNDGIYGALERCTGFTYRLEISSAGKSSGYFYSTWHNTELDPYIYKKRITAFDCSHITVPSINQRIAKYGLHDPLIRSSVFSEFTSVEEQVVITRELLTKSINLCKEFYDFGPLRAGLDLAAGGDEVVFSVWKGNKEIGLQTCRHVDTSKTVRWGIDYLESFKGELKPENVYADDGGVGRGILDNFREKGYTFRRILNQSRPFDTTRYANRGTELWFNYKKFIEEFQVLFLLDQRGHPDRTLFDQLTNRYYFISDTTAKIQLESKQKAKKNGHLSPDRADAVILAWSPYVYPIEDIVSSLKSSARQKPRGLNAEELKMLIDRENDKLFPSSGSSSQRESFKSRYNNQQLRQLGSGATVFSHRKMFSSNPRKKY